MIKGKKQALIINLHKHISHEGQKSHPVINNTLLVINFNANVMQLAQKVANENAYRISLKNKNTQYT